MVRFSVQRARGYVELVQNQFGPDRTGPEQAPIVRGLFTCPNPFVSLMIFAFMMDLKCFAAELVLLLILHDPQLKQT
jgi:hypothetical protein